MTSVNHGTIGYNTNFHIEMLMIWMALNNHMGRNEEGKWEWRKLQFREVIDRDIIQTQLEMVDVVSGELIIWSSN